MSAGRISTGEGAIAPAGDAIHARFTLTREEVGSAQRIDMTRRTFSRTTLFAVLIALGGLAWTARTLLPGDPLAFAAILGAGALGGLGTCAILLALRVPAAARRLYEGSAELRAPIAFDAEGDGFRLTTARSDLRAAWHTVTDWREGGRVVLLYHAPASFQILPRRAFTEGDLRSLRERHAAAKGMDRAVTAFGPDLSPDLADAPPAVASSAAWRVVPADLAAAQRLFLRRHYAGRAWMTAPVLLAAFAGLGEAATGDPASAGDVALAALVGFCLVPALHALLYAAAAPLADHTFRRQPHLHGLWRVDLTEAGLRAVTGDRCDTQAWAGYAGWSRDARMLLVHRGPVAFQMIPARAVDEGFERAFARLAAGLPRR